MSDCIDGEDLANACRRLGISGPLEPLLRELKRESPQPHHQHHHNQQQPHQQQHHHHQKQQSLLQQQQYSCAAGGTGRDSSGNRRHHTPSKSDRKFGRNNNNKEKEIVDDKAGKSSTYGQESWGRDSGARDLSPEPHRVGTSCGGTDVQLTDNETGTTSSMIHLANKVSTKNFINHSYIYATDILKHK